jgi:nitroreductase
MPEDVRSGGSEFREIVRRRRMVRRFDRRPVPRATIDRIIDTGRRAPSAGFSQGLELLVLDTPESVAEFWEITRDPEDGWDPRDVAVGPTVLVLPLPDANAYTRRYSEPDKVGFGMGDEANWPVRFWEIDAAMASMLMLLAAVDEGLGGWFFGITSGERALLQRFGVPDRLRPIGILGFGYRAEDERPAGSSTSRPRRPLAEQIHRNGW